MTMRKWRLILLIAGLWGMLSMGSVLGAPANPRISMNIQNAEVKDVLTSLAATGGVNMIVDETVKGKISLSLYNTPLDEAIDMVVKARGLNYQKMADGTIVVAEAKTLLAGFGAVTVLPLKYAIAAEAKKALAGVVADERLKVDESSNSLVHFGPPSEAALVRAAVEGLDIPYKQVTLEAQVLEVKKTASKDFGVEWSWAQGPMQSGATGDENYENRGAIRFGRAPDGKPYEFRFQAKINALVAKGDAKVLAKPRISTITGKEAKILIGDKIPVQKEVIVDGKSQVSIDYVDTGIRLVYTPIVSPDGMVRAHLLTEVSEPLPALGGTNYQIRTRTAETDLRMADGETLVIGGLINSQNTRSRGKVPVLGDIPILGAFFKNSSNSNEETEIVVVLTARIAQ